ncbi:MAG: hypothetical protein RL260_2529 [Pseudomonadota bacterium]
MTTMFKPCPTPALRLASLVLGVALACQLGGCASEPKNVDDGKSIAKLYEEAREEASNGANDRAIKLYERIEGRAAGTLLSQQAQLEQAYLLYKQQEKARALAVVERFLKLHPTSPAGDYAYYLQGLINFNDDLGLFGSIALAAAQAADAGVTAMPKTLDELVAAAKAIKDKGIAKYPIGLPLSATEGASTSWYLLTKAFGGVF